MGQIIYSNQYEYLSLLRREPDQLIKEMEEFASDKKVPILDWNSAELLEQIVLAQQSQRVLKIGMAIAYSTIRIARLLNKNAVIDAIEKSKDNIALAKDFIKRAKLKSKINIIEGDALKIIPQLDKKYDLIFLDADKQDYENLFYSSLDLLKKGGLMFVDNLLWHGYASSSRVPSKYKTSTKIIREFNKLFISQSNLKSTILPVGDGIGLGVKL